MAEPFVAEIRIFAGNFAPRGWAFCDGQLLPIQQNVALFSLVGTTYGGDGRTTMGLPDLRGRAPMQPGRAPDLTQRRLGDRIGVAQVTLGEAELPNHGHGQWAAGAADDDDPGPSVMPARADGAPLYSADGQALIAAPAEAVGSAGAASPTPTPSPGWG